jgi:hypothetical protein
MSLSQAAGVVELQGRRPQIAVDGHQYHPLEVVCGAGNGEQLAVTTDTTVGEVRAFLRPILGIPRDAFARLDNRPSEVTDLIGHAKVLEFFVKRGEKRFAWEEDELIAKYPWVDEEVVRRALREYSAAHPETCFLEAGRTWYIDDRGLWSYLRKVLGPPHQHPLPDQRVPALRRPWERKRTMSKADANRKAMAYAQKDRRFIRLSSREWARRIGCSESLVRKTAFWKLAVQKTGRVREIGGVPQIKSLTTLLESCIGERDEELDRAIAESLGHLPVATSPLEVLPDAPSHAAPTDADSGPTQAEGEKLQSATFQRECEVGVDQHDEELARLIAESQAEAHRDPSPLDETAPRKVRHFKRL